MGIPGFNCRVIEWLGVITVAAVALVFVDVIPDVAATKSAMIETSVRVGMLVDGNQQLPQSLASLPRRDGYANRVVDAWNRPLHYHVDSPGRFTLTSLGRDGVVGGTGDDAEIIQKYKVVDGKVRREP